MNAVEIEEAVSALAAAPFDRAEFPFQFLTAFGFKDTTIAKLRTAAGNPSDVPGGVLLRTNIHLAVTEPGKTAEALAALKASPKMAKAKCKFVLATDGEMVEAEELATGEALAAPFEQIADHFGFFLPLAGISTVAEIKDNPVDIRATGRLNKLYVELLKDNPEWASDAKRPHLNRFMARLIFCFFAEDTGIFNHAGMFTACLKQMSEATSGNTHEVVEELFRAMNTAPKAREAAKLKRWAAEFPYVNGGLFAEDIGCPSFSKIARSYLLRAGDLDWKQINPDIFGSMIQAVADDDERGSLGMHYTSVPNILKVLDPLFLDDLRAQLEEAADNGRKLLNLRKRLGAIRVFDPACGSGNFLVIAYLKMREIEAEIIRRRKDNDKKSWLKLTNFYGIEIKTFPAEIARLALLIAEFQANVRHIGQREACLDVLPLHETGKIVTGNALQLDWGDVCPPVTSGAAVEEDLAGPTGRMALEPMIPDIETYLCSNPPYIWSNDQSPAQKANILQLQSPFGTTWKGLDYVSGWLLSFAVFSRQCKAESAFVTTNSITQGEQVDHLWSTLVRDNIQISFAHRTFKWSNLAKGKAGVSCVIVGLSREPKTPRRLYEGDGCRLAKNISPYLLPMENIWVKSSQHPQNDLSPMMKGSQPTCGGGLVFDATTAAEIAAGGPGATSFIKRLAGSDEISDSTFRYCLWIADSDVQQASQIPAIKTRLDFVRLYRLKSSKPATRRLADRPHKFTEIRRSDGHFIAVQCVSSEHREYLAPVLFGDNTIVSNRCFGIYAAPLWYIAILSSKLHRAWCETTSGKLETRLNYSNTLTWNTFPVPKLTENDQAALTRCSEDILLAREAHFPATIADLYDPEAMPADLRAAHDRNDETLERIYIGRRFRNDTERLEKLFDMYTKMTKEEAPAKTNGANGRKKKPGKGAAA